MSDERGIADGDESQPKERPEDRLEAFKRAQDTFKLFHLRGKKLFDKLAPEWCKNLRMNIHQPGVLSNHQLTDVPLSPQAAHGRRAWVFASGASLQQYEDTLPELIGNDFVLVSPTVAPWFVVHAKRMPDVVFAIDRSEVMLTDCMTAGLKGRAVRNDAGEIVGYDGPPLVIATTGNNALIRYFAPNVYWFNSLVAVPNSPLPYPNVAKLLEGGKSMDEISELLAQSVRDAHAVGANWGRQRGYSDFVTWVCGHLKVGIDQMGCVTNEALVVVLMLMNWKRLDASEIILAGADLAFWKGFTRVPKGTRDPDGTIHLDGYRRFEDDPDNADFVEYNGLITNSRMLGYTSDMVTLWGNPQAFEWQNIKARLWRLSAGPGESILEGVIPSVTPEQLLSENYQPYPGNSERSRIAKEYIERFQRDYARAVGYDSSLLKSENVE